MPRTKRPDQTPIQGELSDSIPECSFWDEPLGQEEGEGRGPRRIAVRFVSRRVRLIDPDNLTPKYLLDGLRYSGLIPDDRFEDITVDVCQEKVAHKVEEETLVEVRYVDEQQVLNLLDRAPAGKSVLGVREDGGGDSV